MVNFLFGAEDAKVQASMFGFNPESPDFSFNVLAGATQYGKRALQVAQSDIRTAVEMYSKIPLKDEDLITFPTRINSYVVKCRSGGLLLYAPVKLREEFGFLEWLEGLGDSVRHRIDLDSWFVY